MSREWPGLEAEAHSHAAWGYGTKEGAYNQLCKKYPKTPEEVIRAALEGHGPACRHPIKEVEQFQQRLDRKRASARVTAVEALRTAQKRGYDAEATMAFLEHCELVVEHNACRPDHHHHVTPHRSCILR